MGIETIEHNGTRYTEIIWATERVEKTALVALEQESTLQIEDLLS